MSKDIKTYKDLNGKEVHLTSMWGGIKGKRAIQFTLKIEYFQLSEKQLLDLVKVINSRLENSKEMKCKNKDCKKEFEPHNKNQKYCKPNCNGDKRCRCGNEMYPGSRSCKECFLKNKYGKLSRLKK